VARTAMVEVVRLLLLLLLFYFIGKQTGGLGKLKLVGREEGIYVESTGGVGPRGFMVGLRGRGGLAGLF